mmetsp:Transcript_6904/g.12200  ORF Transcript_6904/g.12200 Transcript_6904/m.12200 type:complete len:338 (-) Transcript_6904:64-1077(-)|eukprot:CAMPEP_0197659042 /NCGR_PEP_ID=MMETSP1338-20131121/45961_1 /TAXON_ID=43686 ORGANISM="Pelagodinium beii, Strain RCC1491" /NCGR_SAMPLE_ID=MMETSP1338 /ASSEMBLY_ACC=CAM_ASM_000754 /LENGTH=337 /DNA_ID=CAMNT_0043235785 /DNA_START=59 /DNA_END=1072 /DNA_ORIENTATION=+
MISYESGTWGVGFIWSLQGSVVPKAIFWALPNAILGLALHFIYHAPDTGVKFVSMGGVQAVWSSYTLVLCFLLVFRSSQAYSRFWDGTKAINAVHSQWTNAVGTLVTFCSHDESQHDAVLRFQHLLLRLMSLLFCVALQDVAELDDDNMEIIDPHGICPKAMAFFKKTSVEERPDLLLQWVYKCIVDAQLQGVLVAPPPVLNRAFTELSRGRVEFTKMRWLSDVPFPFPYTQMITVMLMIHWIVMPMLASQIVVSASWTFIICFVVTGVLWSLVYIAFQIDQPFGDDDTDLPLREMMKVFNDSLLLISDPKAQLPPCFNPKSLDDNPELMLSWRDKR